ncbi:MAG: hypothetical protein ACRCXD_11745 [Luteolibacter sp.]
MRFFVSIVLSAALWLILPLTYELLSSGTRTSYGWGIFLADLPGYLIKWFSIFLIVATLMHLAFARVTLQLGRLSFFVFPFFSLLCASIIFVPFWCILVQPFLMDNLGYAFLGVLTAIFFHMIWITYPLALANQWLLREILDTSIRPQERAVLRYGIIERLVVFLRSKI